MVECFINVRNQAILHTTLVYALYGAKRNMEYKPCYKYFNYEHSIFSTT